MRARVGGAWSLGVLAAMLTVLSAGCGRPCAALEADQSRFNASLEEAARAAADGVVTPHAVAVIPFVLLNRLASARIRDLAPVPIALPLPRSIPGLRLLDGLELRVIRARLVHAPNHPGRVGVKVTVALGSRSLGRLLTLDLSTSVRPRFHAGEVSVPIRAQDFDAVRPRLGPRGSKRLAEAIAGLVPARLRHLAPTPVVARVVDQLVGWLGENLYRLLAKPLLTDVATLVTLRWRIPGSLPVRQARLQTGPRAVALQIELRVDAPGLRTPRVDLVHPAAHPRLRVAGGALAALANWAVARERIPARLDARYQPAKDGALRPRFGFRPGHRRSLGVRLLNTAECYAAQVWFVPSLTLRPGHRLTLGLRDGRVERLDAGPLTRLGAHAAGVFQRVVEHSLSVLVSGSIRFGDAALAVGVTAATLEEGELRCGFALTPAAPRRR